MKIIPCNKEEFETLALKAEKQFGELWCKPNLISNEGRIAFIIENGAEKVKLTTEEKKTVIDITRKDKAWFPDDAGTD